MTKSIKYLSLITMLLAASVAHTETINCTAITVLPTVITTPGIYCLTGTLSRNAKTGKAINIKTDDVTIDLNGWTINGLGAGKSTAATGIFVNKRKNITIRNGIIRGFLYGVWLKDITPYARSQNHLIEDIHFDKNWEIAVIAEGSDIILRRNQFVDNGGGDHSWYTGPSIPVLTTYSVVFHGPGARFLDNDIKGLMPISLNPAAYLLHLEDAHGAVVKGNRIKGPYEVIPESHETFEVTNDSRGIHISNSNDVLVIENVVTNVGYGISYGTSSGKYMGNLTSGVGVPFTNGAAVGTNN